jgi:CMP-N-acetylneuraminic acid synthetase
MQILGLVPARGESKSIPRKSIAPLAGRPLLAYTAEAALASACLTRVVLSTDEPDIAAAGRILGLETPFLRPTEFARDDSPAIDVIRHALHWLEMHEQFQPDAVMLLQPTSPLRRSEHIDAACQLLINSQADSVVSVVRVPHQFNPVSVMKVEEGRLLPFLPGPLITRRQEKPVVYARNGPAIVLTRREVIEAGNLYGRETRPLVMDPADSVDIDEPGDLAYVEYLLARRAGPSAVHAKGSNGHAQHV